MNYLSSKNRLKNRFLAHELKIWTVSWTGFFQGKISDRKAELAF